MKKLIFALPLLVLAACAPSSPQTPALRAKAAADRVAAEKSASKAVSTAPDVSSATSYQFSGRDNLNKACSTGLRQFNSLRLLCINLQDPVGNAQCAIDKRVSRFQADCAADFAWEVSISCHFALLDLAADISTTGNYDQKFVKQAGALCAGRTPEGLDLPGSVNTGVSLVDDILYDVDLGFTPHGATGAPSHFKMSIYRKDASGKRTPLIDDVQFLSGFKAVSGQLRGANYKYVLRCENLWACPASR